MLYHGDGRSTIVVLARNRMTNRYLVFRRCADSEACCFLPTTMISEPAAKLFNNSGRPYRMLWHALNACSSTSKHTFVVYPGWLNNVIRWDLSDLLKHLNRSARKTPRIDDRYIAFDVVGCLRASAYDYDSEDMNIYLVTIDFLEIKKDEVCDPWRVYDWVELSELAQMVEGGIITDTPSVSLIGMVVMQKQAKDIEKLNKASRWLKV